MVYEALYASTASWLPHPAGLCWSLAYFLSIRTTALPRLLQRGVCAKPRAVHSLFNAQMAGHVDSVAARAAPMAGVWVRRELLEEPAVHVRVLQPEHRPQRRP